MYWDNSLVYEIISPKIWNLGPFRYVDPLSRYRYFYYGHETLLSWSYVLIYTERLHRQVDFDNPSPLLCVCIHISAVGWWSASGGSAMAMRTVVVWSMHFWRQCWKFPQVHHSEVDNFGGGLGTFCWFFFNFMFMIWDSSHEDLQIFLLSFKHLKLTWKIGPTPCRANFTPVLSLLLYCACVDTCNDGGKANFLPTSHYTCPHPLCACVNVTL